jgi:hypothetical protein
VKQYNYPSFSKIGIRDFRVFVVDLIQNRNLYCKNKAKIFKPYKKYKFK